MISRYNQMSLIFGVPGIILQFCGSGILAASEENPLVNNTGLVFIGAFTTLAGTILLLLGLAYYARAKGRHPAWCVLAFVGLIGLIVLSCLKDYTLGGDEDKDE